LFLRVCEDRNIGKYEEPLKSARDDKLIEAFRSADRAFNAGLFDELTSTTCSSSVLTAVVREAYWPRGKFAFGVLRPDILAEVYDQYLAERVEVDAQRRVVLAQKPELVHAGGVAVTPGWRILRWRPSAARSKPQTWRARPDATSSGHASYRLVSALAYVFNARFDKTVQTVH
jgi:hypothetical protein